MKLKAIFFIPLIVFVTITSQGQQDLDENFVFLIDREGVAAEVKYIKEQFKIKFQIDVEVNPKLIQVDNEGDPLGEYSYHDITFGKLAARQFQRLKNYYRFPLKSKKIPELKYESEKIYTLKDFLLPKIQPLLGKMMFSGVKKKSLKKESDSENYIYFSSNCWSTVHDILISDYAPFSIYGYVSDQGSNGQNIYKEVLGNNKTSTLVNYDSISAYDYFLNLGSDKGINHTGVFVGPGLIFEKVGLGFDRYRVGVFRENSRIKYRKIKSPLPHPKLVSINQLSSEDDIFWEHPLTVVKEPNSQFVLDPSKINSKAVMSPLIRICSREDADKNLCTNYPWESGAAYKVN